MDLGIYMTRRKVVPKDALVHVASKSHGTSNPGILDVKPKRMLHVANKKRRCGQRAWV